jgi:hypothetical protein
LKFLKYYTDGKTVGTTTCADGLLDCADGWWPSAYSISPVVL